MPVEGTIATLRGRVRKIDELLEAPLSGASCVAYHAGATIYERAVGQQWGGKRLTELDHREISPFMLETGEGVVVVDGPEVELAVRETTLSPRRLDRERAFLARHGSDAIDVRTVVFSERSIAPGDEITVHGVVTLAVSAHGEHLFRETGSSMRIVSHAGHPIEIRTPRWWARR